MPDPRFFDALGPVELPELARLTGAEVSADQARGVSVAGVAPLDRADGASVSYFAARRYAEALGLTKAGACFVRAEHAGQLPAGCLALVTPEPQVAYVRAIGRLHRPKNFSQAELRLDPTAELESDVTLAPGVVVGPGVRIGRGTTVGANTVIGPGVSIGRDCVIGGNVSLSFALVGDRVRLLAGAIIGESGFGVAGGKDGAVDIPQLGRVILQDGVTVGAGSCVDRGAWDDTVLGENTKLDNLVQIGHNVRLGRNCMVAAQVGISGTVVAGDGVRFGGRVGIADHVNIGDGAAIMAAAGVMHDIPAGETWGGFPATTARRWMRQVAWLARHANERGGGKAE
jgi:UDP-3-O-[3-hydroxymyristoyl] glucosamine N-acyltransferase